jgi:hypothetical protein
MTAINDNREAAGRLETRAPIGSVMMLANDGPARQPDDEVAAVIRGSRRNSTSQPAMAAANERDAQRQRRRAAALVTKSRDEKPGEARS